MADLTQRVNRARTDVLKRASDPSPMAPARARGIRARARVLLLVLDLVPAVVIVDLRPFVFVAISRPPALSRVALRTVHTYALNRRLNRWFTDYCTLDTLHLILLTS